MLFLGDINIILFLFCLQVISNLMLILLEEDECLEIIDLNCLIGEFDYY